MDIQVLKRDGSPEKYLPEKLVRVAMAAGLNHHQALELSTNIYSWALSVASPIPTSQIRDQMISELKKYDPNAANLYIWYEDTKDNN